MLLSWLAEPCLKPSGCASERGLGHGQPFGRGDDPHGVRACEEFS